MQEFKPPFFYYSKSLPRFLKRLGLSVAYSSFQAGKVVIISSLNGESIIKYARNFDRPMGLDYRENTLAIATRNTVELFSTIKGGLHNLSEQQLQYDGVFAPLASYHIGPHDVHDVCLTEKSVYLVSTGFSSLMQVHPIKGLSRYWSPDFITDLLPEDRCHLNGMACQNDEPGFVTCFSKSDEKEGWRNASYNSGLLIDTRNQEILLDQLEMPHSPILSGNTLYFLQSASGKVMKYDTISRKLECLSEIPSYLRGIDLISKYLVVGCSEIRSSSQSFKDLPVSKSKPFSGIRIIDTTNGKVIAGLTYTDHIKEIFGVKILPELKKPGFADHTDLDAKNLVVFSSGETFIRTKGKKQ